MSYFHMVGGSLHWLQLGCKFLLLESSLLAMSKLQYCWIEVPSVRFISYASYPRVYGLTVLQIFRESIPFCVLYAFNV
jgi:hypothetical protein